MKRVPCGDVEVLPDFGLEIDDEIRGDEEVA
jgi:hypothetical protein